MQLCYVIYLLFRYKRQQTDNYGNAPSLPAKVEIQIHLGPYLENKAWPLVQNRLLKSHHSILENICVHHSHGCLKQASEYQIYKVE